MSRQREKYVIIVTIAMVLIVVAALLGVYADYTDGFKQDFTGLYISAGDTVFYTDSLAVLSDVEFKVHNAWDLNSHYTVQVLPTGEDFFYRIEDDIRWYSYLDSVEELTSAFDIEIKGSRFILRCNKMSVRAVLEKLYGKAVEIPTIEDNTAHFKLVVTSDTGWISDRTIEVTFRCVVDVGGIEIDPPKVTF